MSVDARALAAKTAQEALKTAQKGSKTTPTGAQDREPEPTIRAFRSKTAPEGPKRSPRGPKRVRRLFRGIVPALCQRTLWTLLLICCTLPLDDDDDGEVEDDKDSFLFSNLRHVQSRHALCANVTLRCAGTHISSRGAQEAPTIQPSPLLCPRLFASQFFF